MNKWQAEVLGNRDVAESQVLDELKESYKEALKNIDDKLAELMGRYQQEQLQSIIYQMDYQKALRAQINGILDDLNAKQFTTLSDYLEKCYEDGYIGTMYDLQKQGVPLVMPIDQQQVVRALKTNSKLSKGLYDSLGEDMNELKKKVRSEISRGISQNYSYGQIAANLARQTNIGYNNAVRIARTEGHRIAQEATVDAQYKAKEKGADIVKQWDASLDKRTRESHGRVDGEIRELDEPFSNGLMFPGDSANGSAAEVINCRCALLQRAKWALDEEELRALEERAAYFGLDKTANFEDYKKKYLNSLDKMEETNDNVSELKGKIDKIKERIKKNGITEADLQEAGKLIQDDINNSGLQEASQKLAETTKRRQELIQERMRLMDSVSNKLPWEERKKLLEETVYNTDEYKKVEEEYNNLIAETNKLQQKVWDLQKNGVTNTLSKVRSLGMNNEQEELFKSNIETSDMTLDDNGLWARIKPKDVKWLGTKGKEVLKEAYSKYPTEWLEESLNYNKIALAKSKRGYYYHPGRYADSSVLDLGGGSLSTAIHEMGHRFEYTIPEIKQLEKEFYNRRTKGESLQWLGRGYDKNETTRKDNFINPYMGKDYNGRAYELVSMGFEMAFTEPDRLAKDPDYANFIYGILTLI